MKISDFTKKKSPRSYLLPVLVLFLFSLTAFIFLVLGDSSLGIFQKSNLRIESYFSNFKISIDNHDYGSTPFIIKSFRPGSHEITLSKTHAFYSPWTQKVDFVNGLETYLKRDIGPSSLFSSGELVYFEKNSKGLSIISTPDQATVLVNNEAVGVTPLFLPDAKEGDYEVSILKEGYLGKKLTVKVQEDYATHINADLFFIPESDAPILLRQNSIPDFPTTDILSRESWKADDSIADFSQDEYSPVTEINLYDLSTENSLLYTDPLMWIQGLYYYEISVKNLPDLSWHFFIDRNGKIYEGKKGGFEICLPEAPKGLVKVAYLGNKEEGLTLKAQIAYNLLTQSTSNSSPYSALITANSQVETLSLEAQKTAALEITYQNNGEATWYNLDPKKVYLKASNSLFHNSTWVDNSILQILPENFIAQNQEIKFSYSITSPNADGLQSSELALFVSRNGVEEKIPGSEFTLSVQVTGGLEPMVLIKDTGTGFLNVRDEAGFGGGIIDRVTPGEQYVYLEEQSSWIKLRLPSGTEGWVSTQYVEKLN